MSNNLEGFWKDSNDTNKRRHPEYTKPSKTKKKNKRRKNKVKYDYPKDCFYKSKEWRQLRYLVLKHYGGSCMLCGRTKRHHGIVIHVDHIRSRSRFPNLALNFDNMQVLCEDCNLGKMTQCDDWRPPTKEEVEELLDRALLNDLPKF